MPPRTRPETIRDTYLELIDKHLEDLVNNRATEMWEIEDFAERLHVHPVHLTNTLKALTGSSACGLYQVKILDIAKKMLAHSTLSIHDVALVLTFEPSQFTKWFKRFEGITPKAFRTSAQILKS